MRAPTWFSGSSCATAAQRDDAVGRKVAEVLHPVGDDDIDAPVVVDVAEGGCLTARDKLSAGPAAWRHLFATRSGDAAKHQAKNMATGRCEHQGTCGDDHGRSAPNGS